MAALVGGAFLGTAVSNLSTLVIDVIKKTKHFKSKLNEIQQIISELMPIFNHITRLDEELNQRRGETEKLKKLLEGGEDLVMKCEHINRNLWKRYRHAVKLDRFKRSLVEFNQLYFPLVVMRAVRELAAQMNGNVSIRGCSGVPLLRDTVIGFDERVGELKALVLADPVDEGCSVVVVSAAGGYGKTTLVTMLCHDSDIKGKFGDNIYFVIISNSPDLKVVVKSLLERNRSDNQPNFASEEVAIQEWGNFLRRNESPVLLVLDDIWSDTVIRKFMFKSPGYKILVTSRTAFPQHKNYKLKLLNHQQSCELFCRKAFSEQRTDISDELVDKLVRCCKNHPLALVVIGGMLNGEPVASWKNQWNQLSKRKQSIWERKEFTELLLERSLKMLTEMEPEIMHCFLDLGLFPEDQKIAATALMDMWFHDHDHDHDDKEVATMDMLAKLSSKNLATYLSIKKHIPFIEDECVSQHDMMRAVAIRLSSEGLAKQKERFIIYPDGKHFPILRKTIYATKLSISTDERSSLGWKGIKFPKVKAFVLNFMSKIHPLPKFMKTMKKLEVLVITNYGYNFSELENFPDPRKLSSLTTIRLDHVSISSISTSIFELDNLQKLYLIMCKTGNSFNSLTVKKPLPKLLEMVIDSCDDLLTFSELLCNLISLKKLSITNCHELTSLSEGFGNLESLEVLRLGSCSKLTTLPESLRNLKQLRIMDISHCLSLCKLPCHIGELGSLRKLDVSGCTGLHELPESVTRLHELEVFCGQEISMLWTDLQNVKVKLVEEDPLDTFWKIFSRGY